MLKCLGFNRVPTLLLTALTCGIGTARADVNLNVLSQCDQIEQIYRSLHASPELPSNCRAPRGPIEKAIIARTGANVSQVCFVDPPSTSLLRGFSCARLSATKGTNLTCFRAAAPSDVRQYKEQVNTLFASR